MPVPDIRVTNLVPNKTGVLDRLEAELMEAAAADSELGLEPGDFACHFMSSGQPTSRTGRVVLVEVIGLFDISDRSPIQRGPAHRRTLTVRLGNVLEAFVAKHAPATKQIHIFCPELKIGTDGVHLINREAK